VTSPHAKVQFALNLLCLLIGPLGSWFFFSPVCPFLHSVIAMAGFHPCSLRSSAHNTYTQFFPDSMFNPQKMVSLFAPLRIFNWPFFRNRMGSGNFNILFS